MARLVRGILLYQPNDPYCGKGQKDKSCDFQPQLAQDLAKVTQAGASAGEQRAVGPAALHLLSCNPGGKTQFSGGGNVSHSSRFYQSQGLEYCEIRL